MRGHSKARAPLEVWYQYGVDHAKEVQEGLAAGKTFHEMEATPPEQAIQIRDFFKSNQYADIVPEVQAWWDGYLSRWD